MALPSKKSHIYRTPQKGSDQRGGLPILEEVETLGLGVSMGILFLVEAGEKHNKKHNSVSIY